MACNTRWTKQATLRAWVLCDTKRYASSRFFACCVLYLTCDLRSVWALRGLWCRSAAVCVLICNINTCCLVTIGVSQRFKDKPATLVALLALANHLLSYLVPSPIVLRCPQVLPLSCKVFTYQTHFSGATRVACTPQHHGINSHAS